MPRTLTLWDLTGDTRVKVGTITWPADTPEPTFDGAAVRHIYEVFSQRRGGDHTAAFADMDGWSNGYVGAYTPGREPWTVQA